MPHLISKKRGGRDPERYEANFLRLTEEIHSKRGNHAPRVGEMKDLEGVKRYIIRLIRRTERGLLPVSEAYRKTMMAVEVSKILERQKLETLEKRLERIESQSNVLRAPDALTAPGANDAGENQST